MVERKGGKLMWINLKSYFSYCCYKKPIDFDNKKKFCLHFFALDFVSSIKDKNLNKFVDLSNSKY